MENVRYQLRDLPLLPDHVLLMIYKPYREACALFGGIDDLDTRPVDLQLWELRRTAARIEEELHARGIGAEPWWSDCKAPRQAEEREQLHREEEVLA